MLQRWIFLATLLAAVHPAAAQPGGVCGEALSLTTRGNTTMRYALSAGSTAHGSALTLVMLVGGGGYLDIDERGCARLLSRNVLMRMRPILNEAGITTAFVDTPSDLRTDEGLGGYRIAADHARDLGMLIEALRERTKGQVWIAGHSRGSISAMNAAVRLSGPAAPDGVIVLSGMYVGDARARRPWAAHTVFFADLAAIKVPVLVIGHAADNCVRSPASHMQDVIAKTKGPRQQAVTIAGGPVAAGRDISLAACEVREPHDFTDQQAEVAAGIARFIRGGNY